MAPVKKVAKKKYAKSKRKTKEKRKKTKTKVKKKTVNRTKTANKKSRKKLSKTKVKHTRSVKKSRSRKSKKYTKRKSTGDKRRTGRSKKTSKRITRTRKPKLKLVKKIREFVRVESDRIPFYETFIGDPAGFAEPIESAKGAYMLASRANKKDPEVALPEVFEKAFIGALRKGSFEPEDVMIYRYGILLRPRIGKLTDDLRQKISEHLKEIPGATVHHVFENETFALRINIGSPIAGTLSGAVSDDLNRKKSILSDVYSTFLDYFDNDVDWYAFWDTEEAMYD